MFQDLIERIRKFDEERGWTLFSGSHSLNHLLEELGEVSRCILSLERYKITEKGQSQLLNELARELADTLIMLIKIANLYDVDLVKTVNETLTRLETTLTPQTCIRETEEYLNYNINEFNRKKDFLEKKKKTL